MKSIVFLLAHYNFNGGVARALTSLCNNIDLDKYDVTVLPLYRIDRELVDVLDPRVKVKKGFGFYFYGFSHMLHLLPAKWLYRLFVNKRYDIEVAFQCDIPTCIVGASTNKTAVHAFWMHGFRMYKDIYLKADKVLSVSKFNANRIREEIGNLPTIDYCYNLNDDSVIANMSKEDVDMPSCDGPTLVSVGRFSPEKGYPRLIRILRELRDEGFLFRYVMVGDGPNRDDVFNAIRQYNMSDWITTTGKQFNPHKYTAKGDVFICSSFSEGYSTACSEAAILGVPIITTDVPGGEEIIEECECGFLSAKDDESLKSAIREYLKNPGLRDSWKETMKTSSAKFKLKARRQRAMMFLEELARLSEEKTRQ